MSKKAAAGHASQPAYSSLRRCASWLSGKISLHCLTLIFVSVLSLDSLAQTAPAGLVAAYSFEEGTGTTTVDGSGRGNNGTVSGATWLTTGKYGNALSFDGVNDIVNI